MLRLMFPWIHVSVHQCATLQILTRSKCGPASVSQSCFTTPDHRRTSSILQWRPTSNFCCSQRMHVNPQWRVIPAVERRERESISTHTRRKLVRTTQSQLINTHAHKSYPLQLIESSRAIFVPVFQILLICTFCRCFARAEGNTKALFLSPTHTLKHPCTHEWWRQSHHGGGYSDWTMHRLPDGESYATSPWYFTIKCSCQPCSARSLSVFNNHATDPVIWHASVYVQGQPAGYHSTVRLLWSNGQGKKGEKTGVAGSRGCAPSWEKSSFSKHVCPTNHIFFKKKNIIIIISTSI